MKDFAIGLAVGAIVLLIVHLGSVSHNLSKIRVAVEQIAKK